MHVCGGNADYTMSYDGVREIAATNDMIVVYPQSFCWNMDGDIDETNFETKDGLYPKALMAMICRLTTANEESDTCPQLAT